MRKVDLEVAADAFHWWVEITKFQRWKFLTQQVQQLFHAKGFTRFAYADLSQIPIRIYIEIPPLNHF